MQTCVQKISMKDMKIGAYGPLTPGSKLWTKKVNVENFVCVISQLDMHPLFKILVSIPPQLPPNHGRYTHECLCWVHIKL